MKFGLENISRLCAALDHPERAFQSVLVGGTNGKGSVTAMVHRALMAAGHHAARYTSPHLERLEERYVVGDAEVTTEELRSAAETIRLAVERLRRDGSLESLPTFFECATAVAFELFRRAGVRVAVLEVGLGGRLDATNVVNPIAAAITSIDFDHQAQLGHTLEAIALEKAGIVRPGIPVVCGSMPAVARRVIEQVCVERGALLLRAEACGDAGLPAPAELSLAGAHQQDNAAVAACLLQQIDGCGIRVDAAAIRTGLTTVVWPGRTERFTHRGAEVLIDAAHNPAGARALAAYLRQIGWDDVALVFGAMEDKDIPSMLAALAAQCGTVVCTAPDTPRAFPASELAQLAAAVPGARWAASAVADPAAALARALDASPRVVVAGSIFLLGALRGILRAA